MGDSRPAVPRDNMAEYAGLKSRLIAELHGRVLEIGAGRGANFGDLSRNVEWTGLEPDARARWSLQRTASRHGHTGPVLSAPVERIPLPDDSVDAVLSTVVLCSVRDQRQAVSEVVRVVRPGGRFVFFEHVAAQRRTWSYRAQRIWAPVSRCLDHGCDPARQTWRALEDGGFAELDIRWLESPGPLGITTPLIAGYGVA